MQIAAMTRDVEVSAFGHNLRMSTFGESPGAVEVVCLHRGNLVDGPAPVRLHSSCLMGEVFGSKRCDCAWQLRYAIDLIARTGRGVLVYLPLHDGRGAGIGALLESYELMDRGMSSAEAFAALGHPVDQRDYATAAAALRQLGVREAAVITNNPEKLRAVESAGITVTERLPVVMPADGGPVQEYLHGKAIDFGHMIDGVGGR